MVEIGVVDEEYIKYVVYFVFILVGVIIEGGKIGNGRGFVGVGFDMDVGVVVDVEEVVDDFEVLVMGGEVDGGDVVDYGKFGRGVVYDELRLERVDII